MTCSRCQTLFFVMPLRTKISGVVPADFLCTWIGTGADADPSTVNEGIASFPACLGNNSTTSSEAARPWLREILKRCSSRGTPSSKSLLNRVRSMLGDMPSARSRVSLLARDRVSNRYSPITTSFLSTVAVKVAAVSVALNNMQAISSDVRTATMAFLHGYPDAVHPVGWIEDLTRRPNSPYLKPPRTPLCAWPRL